MEDFLRCIADSAGSNNIPNQFCMSTILGLSKSVTKSLTDPFKTADINDYILSCVWSSRKDTGSLES